MTNYKNLLFALGITISGSQISAGDDSLFEDVDQTSSTIKDFPSLLFLEVGDIKDTEADDWNVGCSETTNSGCK